MRYSIIGGSYAGISAALRIKRIDILATAIQNNYSVEQLNHLDLTYTPPLSSPWDPVQMAAQEWVNKNLNK